MNDTIADEIDEANSEEQEVSLQLENITKTFEGDSGSEIVAVDDISLDIYDGE